MASTQLPGMFHRDPADQYDCCDSENPQMSASGHRCKDFVISAPPTISLAPESRMDRVFTPSFLGGYALIRPFHPLLPPLFPQTISVKA